jgi:hypothetical protein
MSSEISGFKKIKLNPAFLKRKSGLTVSNFIESETMFKTVQRLVLEKELACGYLQKS